jgi:hypothetical protein
VKKRFAGGTFNGQDGTYYRAEDWQVSADAGAFQSLPDPPDYNTVMTRTIAGTSPTHADWSAANAIYELKDFRDIPRNIRDLGNDILLHDGPPNGIFKTHANDYLVWTFGIQPLISDLQQSLKFIKRTESRLDDLNGFSRPNGVSKNRTIYKETSPRQFWGTSYCTGVYGAQAVFSTYLTTSRKIWGSVNWQIPPENLPPKDSSNRWALANRLANGLQISPSTLWNAMPWTWMIDWFSNIGDFIDIAGNAIGARSGRYCVMEHVRVQCHCESGSPGFTPLDGAFYETKARTPMPFVYPEVRLPFISNGMAGILSSLAIQRAPRI